MVLNMKEIMFKEKNKVKENFSGQMDLSIRVNLQITIFMDKEPTHGQMEECIKENGRITKWMEMVNLLGQMEENILVVMSKIKNMDMVNFNGQMAECIKEIGKMANNMEKEFTLMLKESRERENGKMERELVGLMNQMTLKKKIDRNIKIILI